MATVISMGPTELVLSELYMTTVTIPDPPVTGPILSRLADWIAARGGTPGASSAARSGAIARTGRVDAALPVTGESEVSANPSVAAPRIRPATAVIMGKVRNRVIGRSDVCESRSRRRYYALKRGGLPATKNE